MRVLADGRLQPGPETLGPVRLGEVLLEDRQGGDRSGARAEPVRLEQPGLGVGYQLHRQRPHERRP